MSPVSLVAVLLSIALLWALRRANRELAQARADLTAHSTNTQHVTQQRLTHSAPGTADATSADTSRQNEIEEREARIMALQIAEMQSKDEILKMHERIKKLQGILDQRDVQLDKLRNTIKAQERVIKDLSRELRTFQTFPENIEANAAERQGTLMDTPEQPTPGWPAPHHTGNGWSALVTTLADPQRQEKQV